MEDMTERIVRIVSGLGFDPLEYAADRTGTVGRVLEIFTGQSGIHAEECAVEVEKVLESIYEDAKGVSVEAEIIPDHLRTGGSVGVVIGGELIWGLVDVTPKVLSVEITEPYRGRRSSSEIEMLAPRIWTEQPCDGSEANEEGRRRAVSMLAGLYYSILENHC